MGPCGRRRDRPRLAAACLFASLVMAGAGPVYPVGQEFVPLDSWAYDAVSRFETLGLCTLPGDRPFTRPEFAAIVAEIGKTGWDRRLCPRDRYELARLEKEFTDFASQQDPQRRYDPPTIYYPSAPLLLTGDVDVVPALAKPFFDDREQWLLGSNPELQVHWGERLSMDVRYRLLLGPEYGSRAGDRKPSPREKSYRGLTAVYERGYVIAGWEKAHAFVGREAIAWGPEQWGNLIAPGPDYPVDQLGLRLRLGPMRLSYFHGTLSPELERRFAAHRLEVRWRGAVFGVNEAVVYAGRGPDPIYLIPIAIFSANRFNEKHDSDNIVWSLDAKARVLAGLSLYGSLLLDEFHFGDADQPDRLAYDVGATLATSFPLAATVRASYRRVDIYTLTQADSLTAYVGGRGDVDAGDPPLGAEPGPDSDRWRVEAAFYPRANAVARAWVSGERRGEGNDFRSFRPGDDPHPPFPLGVTERRRTYGVALRWELDRNRFLTGAYSYMRAYNVGHDPGVDDSSHAFRVAIHWEFI